MANQLNIDGSDDPSYRYKMPKLIGKVEGRGNGIKTVVVNLADLSASLQRPQSQILKFLGVELAAMSRIDPKEDRAIINGAFDTNVLQDLLFKYIEKFILCPSCNNPETDTIVKGKKKSAEILLECKACGEINHADNTHKLCTAIIKEMTEHSTLSKKERRKKKGELSKNTADGESSVASGEKKKKKKKKDKKEKKEKKDKKEKKKKRDKKDKSSRSEAASEAPPAAPVLTIHDAAAIEDAVDKVRAKVSAGSLSNDDLLKEVMAFQVNCGLRKLDGIAIFFFAAIADQAPADIPKYMSALALLAQTEEEQLEVLSCLEESVSREIEEDKRAIATKVVPLVLKNLYDHDVVEEEIILGWHSGKLKPSHVRIVVEDEVVEAVKTNAKPIVDWLKTVSEDEDDEDEQEEEAEDEDDNYDPQSVFGGAAGGDSEDETDTDSDSD